MHPRRLHDDPLHPYTAALAAARPSIDGAVLRLSAIPGRPISGFEAPADACPFVARCPHAEEVCEAERPNLLQLDGGQTRCVRAHELRGLLQVSAHE